MSEFASQTELGFLFSVSSHEIGRWLIDIGLRTQEKRPSRKAFEDGFVERAPTGRGTGYFYVWHRDKVVNALQAAGHTLPCDPEPIERLVGPFKATKSSTRGFEIVDGVGEVGIWVMGSDRAEKITAVLNLAFKHGLFQ